MKGSDDKLLGIARALADSQNVDWAAAEADAEDHQERELVGLLRDIGELADVHRTRSKDAETMAQEATGGNLAAGSAWGQLELVGLLGEGASAQVFRAHDRKLDREVALKLFRPDARMHLEQRRALLLEGRNLARLRHENVVTVLGADEHDGRIGIWMELVEGRTLSEIVYSQGPYSATEATQIGIELCRALAAVHRKGLVHGDLKAQNVKREEGGRIVLMDFSSSRGSEQSPGNPESDPTGTPLYMAPELWERQSPTVESDIYALGVLLYHLVTGEFPVRAVNIEELRSAHARGVRTLLRDERPGLPEGFVRIVEKSLSRDPNGRFPSAGAFEEALRDELRATPGGGIAVSPASPPLPLEVRIIARLARVGLWIGGIALLFVLLGFITSNAFNITLGRPKEFATESIWDWFIWGFRVSAPPLIYMTLYAAPVLLLVVLWWLAKSIPPIGRRLRRFRAGVASRLAWADPALLATLLFLAGLISVVVVCWRYADIIRAAATPIGEVDREQLDALSPDNIGEHIAYGRWLDAIMLVIGFGAYRVFRLSKQHQRNSGKQLAAVILVLTVTVLLWVFPYRILWQNQFEKVRFENERAYIIGQKPGELLIHRPDAAPPRNRIIPEEHPGLVRLQVYESVFSTPDREED